MCQFLKKKKKSEGLAVGQQKILNICLNNGLKEEISVLVSMENTLKEIEGFLFKN